MAQTGKKINELAQISTVTNETVLPGVYVENNVANSTASKITIQQISSKVQNDMSGSLAGKQDTLVSGSNIKTINGETVLGSGDLKLNGLPDQTGQSGKFLTTNGTTASWDTVQSGGSAPTLTWYTGNTGTTVTIADTSTAALVKIYKNGLLLQPTEDYSISGTTLTMVTSLVSTDKITTEVF